jgi:hypothetical protein
LIARSDDYRVKHDKTTSTLRLSYQIGPFGAFETRRVGSLAVAVARSEAEDVATAISSQSSVAGETVASTNFETVVDMTVDHLDALISSRQNLPFQ